MRALHVPAAGAQPQLSEVPVPEPVEGTVLIKVKAAGLNAVDNAIAAGMMASMAAHHYPLTLGRDVAGIVHEVGAGVDHVRPGDEVVGHIPFVPPIQAGTLAEYALLPASSVTPKPAGLDFTRAAALPLAGAAALGAVDIVSAEVGQSVLVIGASGGVGSYAVQLLAARGVTVLATADAADADRVKGLGAATVIDYTRGDVAAQVRAAHPDGVDALVDLIAYAPDALPLDLVRKGGKVASTLGAADDQALAARGLTGGNVMAAPGRDDIAPLAEQAAAGTLTVDVTTVLPLESAAEGLATIASGTARGKIVITIAD
ncbi:NADP-dependent oxidoreductase [Streptomyces europaeiscabiei]|uniref:NADP-dependent oxidoreductase n=1 Tax=Streptomyces europaeiscabiei TaxID=146819 RepID=UPI0029B9EC3C|nr:NADP-dependent oxidoreductase [Streptomyces europaeiscabiei]MDX3636382.1 NADP-dependent oxidoreductase [Streptomyces europaeiscabiei]MDX3654523.1 NADP-dependent oxidoreductase [Streptomyces europaeiscabiei]